MAVLRVEIKPGVDVELTPTANRGGWSLSDKVRFREGRIEKLRGRQIVPMNPPKILGVCRALHWWVDLSGRQRFAIGTHLGLQILDPNNNYTLSSIRPIIAFFPGEISSRPGWPYELLIWSLDNFGQDLLAVPSGQGLFVWPPTTASPPPAATLVAQAPEFNQGGLQTMPQQIFMLFGSSPDGGTLDPLLLRWCDQSDFTVWEPTTTNAAGSFRLSRGSRIVGAIQSPLGLYIFTDLDMWTAVFEGQPNIFGFFQMGSNCGLIAQRAVVVAGTTPYWMSDHGFFTANQGGPVQIPCTVWDFVYLDLDMNNSDKCFAGLDYHFNEVFFFFASASGGTGEVDSFVKFNFIDNVWDAGRLQVTAWVDQNRPGTPVNVGLDGMLAFQDTGLDNLGSPMIASAQSAFQDLIDGSRLMYVDRLFPDFIWEGNGPHGTVPQADITLLFRRYPEDPPTECGPFTITPDTEYVTLASPHPSEPGIIVRPRGREWAVRIEWNALDSWSRWGAPRLALSEDGRWQ